MEKDVSQCSYAFNFKKQSNHSLDIEDLLMYLAWGRKKAEKYMSWIVN